MRLSTFKQSYAQRRKAASKQTKTEDIPATAHQLSQNLERIRTSLQLPVHQIAREECVSKSSSPDNHPLHKDKLNITTLPTEILLRIFHYLRPPTSVLIGLTCRRFYKLHWSIHGKVKLKVNDNYIISDPKIWEWLLLYHFLQQWMGPQYMFDVRQGILIKKKKLPR